MICILHGYLLEGSGSNLWTRSIIRSLCHDGETVHLLCQENHPEIYDFISQVYFYHLNGSSETIIDRDVPYPGQCIMHKPEIGKTLPVYVWDKYEEFSDVQPMVDLSDDKINYYINRNVKVLKHIINENDIKVIHANHAVLMSVVAQRVCLEILTPYAIMPHGSAIEYAVKKDKRFYNYALESFKQANRIYVIGKELRQRVKSLFPDVNGLEDKVRDLHLGVDTDLFKPITKNDRYNHIELLCKAISNVPRGKDSQMSDQFEKELFPQINQSQLIKLIEKNLDYNLKKTDKDLESRLRSINWNTDEIILFVGRIIASKGIHSIIVALPKILEAYPNLKLIVVGHGPLREPLEAFIWALQNGARELVKNIIEWGYQLEGSGKRPLKEIEFYFAKLKNEGELDTYFAAAQKYISRDTVIFTGYLTHRELQYLFPACDVAIFPSVVAEAGPLVFLEAMASGCFPIGTYFAGMAASIDSVAGAVPDTIIEWMKLSAHEQETTNDIVNKVIGAITVGDDQKRALARIAVEKYDWKNISKRLAQDLYSLVGASSITL